MGKKKNTEGEERAPKRHVMGDRTPPEDRRRGLEERFGGDVGFDDPSTGIDEDHRMRERIEKSGRRDA